MPLFEVAILERPTSKEAEDGAVEKLILPPTPVLAADKQGAAVAAVLDNSKIEVERARMEILVRPFV
jgi:hypothetical protein